MFLSVDENYLNLNFFISLFDKYINNNRYTVLNQGTPLEFRMKNNAPAKTSIEL